MKLGRDAYADNGRYTIQQSKDFDYQYDSKAQEQAEWGSTNPRLQVKAQQDSI